MCLDENGFLRTSILPFRRSRMNFAFKGLMMEQQATMVHNVMWNFKNDIRVPCSIIVSIVLIMYFN